VLVLTDSLLHCAVLCCALVPQMDGLESLNYDDLTTVAKLTSEPHYQSVMQVRSVQRVHGQTQLRRQSVHQQKRCPAVGALGEPVPALLMAAYCAVGLAPVQTAAAANP
jgi:hypothetical protein